MEWGLTKMRETKSVAGKRIFIDGKRVTKRSTLDYEVRGMRE